MTFALLIGLWDLVFSPIGIYSIIKEKKECLSYFLMALIVSCAIFVFLFIWKINIMIDQNDDIEKLCIYSVYPIHLLVKLLLLFITLIIYQFKGINSDNSNTLMN